MSMISINPFTPLAFLAAFFFDALKDFSTLYLFIFLHEGAHFLTAKFLHEKPKKIHLLPWGCMLSLTSPPYGIKGAAVFLAGPLLNLILFFLGFYPKQNLVLALFNLLPVLPLDGGEIVALLFPRGAFFISVVAVAALFIFSFYFKIFPILPIFLTLLVLFDKKSRIEREITRCAARFLDKK